MNPRMTLVPKFFFVSTYGTGSKFFEIEGDFLRRRSPNMTLQTLQSQPLELRQFQVLKHSKHTIQKCRARQNNCKFQILKIQYR